MGLPVPEDLPPRHADDAKDEPAHDGEAEAVLEDVSDGGVLAATEDGGLAAGVVGDASVHIALQHLEP